MNDHFEKKCQFEKNMNNQIEQNYEQSIWTEISTIILSKNFEQKCQQSILNKKVNKQFEQKNQQLTRRKT